MLQMGELLTGSLHEGRTSRENRMELYTSSDLYSAFMKLAPLLILKLLATSGFGSSENGVIGQGRVAIAGDVVLMASVVVGGFVAILVLGGVLPPSAGTRGVLVVAASLSLLVLANVKLAQIASLYHARPRQRSLGDATGGRPS
jgi:hypothetical protein